MGLRHILPITYNERTSDSPGLTAEPKTCWMESGMATNVIPKTYSREDWQPVTTVVGIGR